jgi:tRNA/rRNA methyltransferase
VLDGEEAQLLRALLAEHQQGSVAGERGPVRGLSRLLRRNPTDAERALWDAVTKDRRFATYGFKRQTPVGRHIIDLVSFQLRMVIDIVPDQEEASAAVQRAEKRAWLTERDYQVMEVRANEVAADVAQVLERIAAAISQP